MSRRVHHLDGSGPVPAGVPVVLQSARWDRLKDPTGVIALFRDHLAAAHPRARYLAPRQLTETMELVRELG